MSLPRFAILAIVLVAVLPIPASASGGHDLVSCGGGVRATAVGCGKARRIAKEYARTHQHSLWSYVCSSGDNRGRCVLDRKVVTFPVN
jgi:hypothetical protein